MNRTAWNCSSCNAPLTLGALRCDYCGNATPAAARLVRQPAVITTVPAYRPLERYEYARSDRGRVRFGTAFPAIMRCFAKYIGFTGRASLAEFWWWVVFQFVVFWLIFIVNAEIDIATHRNTDVAGTVVLWWWALTFFPGWAVTVRRLHDVRRSGWNTFWLLTWVGALPLLYWVSLPSDSAPNNPWGPPDPI